MAGLTPGQAVDRLEALHASACDGLRLALSRFAAEGLSQVQVALSPGSRDSVREFGKALALLGSP